MLQSESATSDKTMDSETATLRENMVCSIAYICTCNEIL